MTTYKPHWRERNGYEYPQKPLDAPDVEAAQRLTRAMAPPGATRVEVREMDGETVVRRWRLDGAWREHSERDAFLRRIEAAEAETRRARDLLATADAVIASLLALGVPPAQADPCEHGGIGGAKWEWTRWVGRGHGGERDPWVTIELGGWTYAGGGAYEAAHVDEARWHVEGTTDAWRPRRRVSGTARVVDGRVVFPAEVVAWIAQATGARRDDDR